MAAKVIPTVQVDAYLRSSFDTYYDSYFEEMASEALIGRWQGIDRITGFLVAATASGSAAAGWALWSAPGWKLIWAAIAGVATVASIGNNVMRVPERLKQQGEIRRGFSVLRIDVESYRGRLKIGLDGTKAKTQLAKLQERYSKLRDKTSSEIIYTTKFRSKIKAQLNSLLREKGEIR